MATGNNISEKIADIVLQKNKIRDWLISIGKAENGSKLSDCATAVSTIPVHLSEDDFNIQEGASYTIPAGYHDGTQVITNVSEEAAGAYRLYEQDDITPTEALQTFSIPSGYYGYSAFKVNAIPTRYKDVTSVTATAENVLAGSVFVTKTGTVTTGTMVNNGAVSKTLTGMDATNSTYTIPKGYHNGSGKVSLTSDIENALAEI